MLRATLKNLLSRKLRLILSGLAVVLGVMGMSAAFVLTDTLGKSFDGLFSTIFSSVDVQVAAKPATGSDNGGGPPQVVTIPASAVDKVRAVPGVAEAKGSVFTDGARVIGKNGKVMAGGGNRFGASWTGDNTLIKLRDGKAPGAADEVVINGGLAKSGNFKIGDPISVLTLKPKQTFTVVGIFGYSGDRDSLAGETTVAFTEPVAQELMLGERNVYSSIDVTAAKGTTPEKVRDDIRNALGTGFDVKTGKELGKENSDNVRKGLDFFSYILAGFAGVALLVGIFLIINTFSIIVAQRSRELALMRALGGSRKQIIGSVLLEALIVGTVASLFGIGIGIGIGALLGSAFPKLIGADIPLNGIGIPAAGLIVSFVLGIFVTLVAALLPAYRASRVAPVEAMRDAATPDKPLTRITIFGAVVSAAAGTLLWFALAGKLHGNTLWGILGGVLLAFVGVAMLTPIVSRPVVSLLGRVLSWSLPGKLGRRNSARNPRRTAITAAALMIGVALVTGIAVLFTSAKTSIGKQVEKQVHAQLIISGEQTGPLPPTFDPAVVDKIRQLPGVDAVSDFSIGFGKAKGKDAFIMATTDPQAARTVLEIQAKSGDLAGLTAGRVGVDEQTAKDIGVKVGDTVEITFPQGPKTYTVALVYANGASAQGWLLGKDDVAVLHAAGPARAFIKISGDVGAVKTRVDDLLKDSPEVSVQDQSAFVKQATSGFDIVLNMIQILLALAMVIAILGVINTLALSVLERTREIGLLRAVGLSRARTMWMVTVESIVISVFGALLGIGVGIGLGAAVVRALKDQGFSDLALPWGLMVNYVIVAAFVGVIAAILPAIRAARLNVLGAIAYE